MKRIVVLIAVAAMLLGVFAVSAQEPTTGSGGPVVEGNFTGSTNFGKLNPLLTNDTATLTITSLMFPFVMVGSPFTQALGLSGDEGITNALATGYTVSDDGLTYTVTMRQDAHWSDGEPVTAWDVKFSFDAIASGEADTPLTGLINYVPEGNPTGIKEINVLDDYTFEAAFEQPGCTALGLVGNSFYVIPSHVWGYDGSPDFDFSVLTDDPYNTNPSVIYGPFEFASLNPGEAVAVKAFDNWPDGVVVPSGYIYRDVPDQTVEVEQFLAGQLNYIDGPAVARRADIRAANNVVSKDFPGNSWDYMGFNLADPNNPQPGLDADGNPIDQGHHPIFGDVRVRRAIQMAIDVQGIIDAAVFGEGSQMASDMIPTSWAVDPTLAPVPYDPEGAAALLDEAGWPVGEDGVRHCQGCMYAEEGTPFEFSLITNEGNTRREAIGVVIQDELHDLGITVDFQSIDWQTLLAETMGAQTFDAYIIGWREGFPSDPDQLQLFGPSNDDPANQGSNAMSYNNPKLTDLMIQANSVPGCDIAKRQELYAQIQKILQDDQPYVWLFVQNTMYAANKDVTGFDPYPNTPQWNLSTWQISAD
jgi:peptide/nickel transport system substrate-binding protein